MSNQNQEINAEKITEILKDKYHNNLTTTEIKKKYNISQKVWNEINKKFSEMFIKRYGKKAQEKVKVSADELNQLWSSGSSGGMYSNSSRW